MPEEGDLRHARVSSRSFRRSKVTSIVKEYGKKRGLQEAGSLCDHKDEKTTEEYCWEALEEEKAEEQRKKQEKSSQRAKRKFCRTRNQGLAL